MSKKRRREQRREHGDRVIERVRRSFLDTFIEQAEEQIREFDPPQTRQMFNRLVAEGHSEEEAKELIGQVIMHHVWKRLELQERYSPADFILDLTRLPTLPQSPLNPPPSGEDNAPSGGDR